MFELKTYRFTFDPSRNRWQVATPRQYRKLGTSRTGLKTYEIRNIPEYYDTGTVSGEDAASTGTHFLSRLRQRSPLVRGVTTSAEPARTIAGVVPRIS